MDDLSSRPRAHCQSYSLYPPLKQGFTLFELLLVLSIFAFSAAFLMPNWSLGLRLNELSKAHQDLSQLLMQSRAWAIAHGQTVTICGWQHDCNERDQSLASNKAYVGSIISFVDENNDRRRQAKEQLVGAITTQNVDVSFNRGNTFSFSRLGFTSLSGSWRLCLAGDQKYATDAYKLIMTSTGSARTERIQCDA